MHFIILKMYIFWAYLFVFSLFIPFPKKTKSRSSPAIPRSKALANAYCGISGYALTQNATQKNKFYQNLNIFYCFTIIIYTFAI